MKIKKVVGLLVLLISAGLSPARADSIVQITAEAQGLELLSPDAVPPCGTFWLVTSNAGAIPPFPFSPFGSTEPVYQIDDGQFLVDASEGQVCLLSHGTNMTVETALATQATAVVNLIEQVDEAAFDGEVRMLAHGMAVPLPGSGDGDGGTNEFTFNTSSLPIDTNRLWLEITNVSGRLAHLNLHHATNQVYAIWCTTNLLTPWQVALELWPTGQQTNGMPFTIAMPGRPNLFVWAEDWTGVTEHGNTTPDWWFWDYFGTTALLDTNLDNVGNELSYDYDWNFDPNSIQFSLRFANDLLNTSLAYGNIDLVSGIPGYQAVLVNDTDPAHAVWQPYSASVLASLNSGDGIYTVMVGVRGAAPNATPTWVQTTLTLNTRPLVITITNPVATAGWKPLVQVQGFANKPLTGLSYDLTNAMGIFTNQAGFIIGQAYDANLLASAAYFQCYDLTLTNGINRVTLHATDIFGNTATTNLSIMLNPTNAIHPPALTLGWPTNHTVVAGTNFMLYGMVDDATAKVAVRLGTNVFQGLVERNGRFSVANLPLSGTNVFTVSATNVASLGVSQIVTLVQGAVAITIDAPPANGQEFITASGTVSDGTHDIYVNGIKAAISGDPVWQADNVPILDDQGSGQITVNIYPSNSDVTVTPPIASQQFTVALQPRVQTASYQENFAVRDDRALLFSGDTTTASLIRSWNNDTGGANVETIVFSPLDPYTLVIDLIWPVYWPDGQGVAGTIVRVGGTPDLDSAFSPSAWGNASLQASGPVPFNDPYPTIGTARRQMTRTAVTDVQLVGGGPALPDAFQLVRLLVSAAGYSDNGLVEQADFYAVTPYTGFEGPGDLPLPASAIQILGQPVIPTATNAYVGEKYVLIPAGAVHSLPVKVTGTNSDNYSFAIPADNGLRIYDANSGQDLTTQTNVVIVGQKMNLVCQTVSTNGPSLSNFQWNIPGNAISNYVVAPDASSAMVVTNFATNNATTTFYWVDGTNNRVVQCSATVEGKTVLAKAIFNVIRPTIDWVGKITGATAVDTNYVYLGANSVPGAIWLHLGNSYANDDSIVHGITFTATNLNLNGYAGEYNSLFSVQVLPVFEVEHCNTNGTTIHRTSFGMDTTFPYASLNGALVTSGSDVTHDAPATTCRPKNNHVAYSGEFEMYLMFQAENAIPVPLNKISWKWAASAGANSSFQWTLMDTNAVITANNQVSFSYPQWSQNVTNDTPLTNNICN